MNSLIVTLFCLTKLSCVVAGKQSLAKEAIISLVHRNMHSGTSKVDFIFFERSKDLIEEVIRHSQNAAISRNILDGTNPSWNFQLAAPSVLVFESAEIFIQNVGAIKWLSNPSLRHKHIVYAPGLTSKDIIENTQNGFDIDKVAFLMHETRDSIDLVSSFMFTPQKCRENQVKAINRFNGTTFEWESDEFYPRKYQNLHNCNLMVGTPKAMTNRKITPLLAKLHNFNVVAVRNAPTESVDLVENFVYASAVGTGTVFSTPVFCETYVVAAPLLGEPNSQFEKMFMMFDEEVWVAIVCMLLFYMISIQAIKCCPIKVQNYVFGRNIRSPLMNLTDIFLNGGQCMVPTRNFSRFMLILVIVWSLIVRTCYQSMLFEYLQADKRKTYTLSYYDLFEEDTKFEIIDQFEGIACRTSQCLDIVAEYANKKVFITADYTIDYIEDHIFSSGFTSLRMLSETAVVVYWFPYFATFNPYFEEFNAKLSEIVAAGLFGSWDMHDLRKASMKDRSDNVGPQVLTMEHLEVAFIICSVPAILAVIVFCFEVLVHRIKTRSITK